MSNDPPPKSAQISPLTTAIIAAIVGLFGTLAGGVLNIHVERQKQEGSLILEGIKTGDKQAAARNLLFFAEAGLIHLSEKQVETLRKEIGTAGDTVPVLPRPTPGPGNISFTPSRALTPELQKSLTTSLRAFQQYAKGLGFVMGTDVVQVRIVPGSDTSAGGKEGWLSYYEDATHSMVTASDYADDTNMVLREYAHHVLLQMNHDPEVWRRPDYRAIESGLASYLPCSFGDHPAVGDKSAAAMKGEFRPQSLLNVRRVQEIDLGAEGSVQRDGSEIWGGTFWEIRKSIGRDAADRLLVKTWTMLVSSKEPNDAYPNFARTILSADRSLNGGANVGTLTQILARRGVQNLSDLFRRAGSRSGRIESSPVVRRLYKALNVPATGFPK